MIRSMTTALFALGLSGVVLLSGGCQNSIDSSDLRSDWTPELQSVTYSAEEFANYRTRHRNNNWRQLHDDWAMIWFEDRNLMMSPYKMPAR